jgi:Ca2+-binding RTX toxin-like protein
MPSQWTSSTSQESNDLVVGSPQQTFEVENAGQSWSLTNPGGDNSTLRFELRPGDHWSSSAWTDPSTSERTEIADTTRYSPGTNIHLSYDFQVEPGAANDSQWVVLGQFHQDPGAVSPPFEIELIGEKMAITIAEGGSNYQTIWTDASNIVRGHNYHMDINVTFDLNGNGHLDVSRDGVQIVNYDGTLGTSGMETVYWKEGIYRHASNTTIAADYSNLSITTGDTPTTSGGAPPASIPAAANADGTSGADTLAGQADVANHIRGYEGNDSLVGGDRFNDINGNQGDDIIVGHSTVGDWLLGGQGQDNIDASASTGANILNGNLGSDTIIGGSGADSLRGGQGDDVIHAGTANDWVSGDLGNNTIYGGQGATTFHASAGHDYINGWHAGDHVQLDGGVTADATQVGADVHVALSNGGQMELLNTQLNSLQSGWLIS